MERFIPKKKLSKKARRKLDRAGRQTWEISPVSRKVKSKKIYDRKRARQPEDSDPGSMDGCVTISPSNSFFVITFLLKREKKDTIL